MVIGGVHLNYIALHDPRLGLITALPSSRCKRKERVSKKTGSKGPFST